jgi:mannose-6-phosphate isomerase-like protein (cupin superfamily)
LAGEQGRSVKKPWGSELIWAETDRYVGKVISINPGQRLSLQYHERKDEAIFVTEGTLRLHLEDPSGEIQLIDLAPGEYNRIPVGRRHRFEALKEPVKLVEVSTPELDDVIRLEDDYAREGTNEP